MRADQLVMLEPDCYESLPDRLQPLMPARDEEAAPCPAVSESDSRARLSARPSAMIANPFSPPSGAKEENTRLRDARKRTSRGSVTGLTFDGVGRGLSRSCITTVHVRVFGVRRSCLDATGQASYEIQG